MKVMDQKTPVRSADEVIRCVEAVYTLTLVSLPDMS